MSSVPAPRSPRGAGASARRAYQHGRDGDAAPSWVTADPDHFRAYETGASDRDGLDPTLPAVDDVPPAAAPTRAAPAGRSVALPSTGSGAGLLLGAVVYAATINYLRGGVPQLRQWAAAKFLNKTAGGT